MFFHSHVGLKNKLQEEESKDTPDDTLVADLNTALKFIQEDHGDTITDFERLLSHQEITYDLLWALFKPNTLIYHYHELTEQPQILKFRTLKYSQRQDKSLYAAIVCDVVSNDGNSFGLARNTLEIDAYQGARRIQDLPLYPLSYNKDKDRLRETAIRRGKKFVQMEQHSYNEIRGAAMRETMNADYKYKRFKFNVSTHFLYY